MGYYLLVCSFVHGGMVCLPPQGSYAKHTCNRLASVYVQQLGTTGTNKVKYVRALCVKNN